MAGSRAPRDHLLVLSGQMSPAEVGTAVAAIVEYAGIRPVPVSDLHHHLDEYLSQAEALLAPGGLRWRDTVTGAEIIPGCCFGLENWRDWRQVSRGESIWPGHQPGTVIQHGDEAAGLWQDRHGAPVPSVLQIRKTVLPGQLESVQQQLQEFLGLVRRWAAETCPAAAARLVTALDENLAVSAGRV